jgi:hypothetical protein
MGMQMADSNQAPIGDRIAGAMGRAVADSRRSTPPVAAPTRLKDLQLSTVFTAANPQPESPPSRQAQGRKK